MGNEGSGECEARMGRVHKLYLKPKVLHKFEFGGPY